MVAALILLQTFVLPIVLVSDYEAYRKRQVAFFSTSLGILGVFLALLGSMVMVPYTTTETFNNRPHGYTVWADESFTLQPYTNKYYEIDLIRENHTLAYIKVKETTNPIFFEIKGPKGYGYGGNFNRIIIKQYVPSIEGPVSPFEYFWTPPRRYVWDFAFENPHDTATNVTVKIICYNYNAEWQEKVTRYTPAINPNFAYVGITFIIAGIVLNLYWTKKH